ncbi:hypothetical protein D3C87_1948550 [compost metagenome]
MLLDLGPLIGQDHVAQRAGTRGEAEVDLLDQGDTAGLARVHLPEQPVEFTELEQGEDPAPAHQDKDQGEANQ